MLFWNEISRGKGLFNQNLLVSIYLLSYLIYTIYCLIYTVVEFRSRAKIATLSPVLYLNTLLNYCMKATRRSAHVQQILEVEGGKASCLKSHDCSQTLAANGVGVISFLWSDVPPKQSMLHVPPLSTWSILSIYSQSLSYCCIFLSPGNSHSANLVKRHPMSPDVKIFPIPTVSIPYTQLCATLRK